MENNQNIKNYLSLKPAWIICATSLICAYIIDYQFHHYFSGIILFLLNLVAVSASAYLWFSENIQKIEKNTKLVLPWLFLSLSLSVWLFIRDSGWLYFFNIATAFTLFMLFILNTQKKNIRDLKINIWLPFIFFGKTISKIADPLNILLKQYNLFSTKKWRIIRNLILALPIVILVMVLLYSADMIFQKYLDEAFKILDLKWLGKNFSHFFSLLYFFICSGIFAAVIFPEKIKEENSKPDNQQGKNILEIVSLLISIILLVFSWVQIKYLFAGPGIIEKLGIGYQEYAHKGFYQLMIVAIINFLVIWLMTGQRKDNTTETLPTKKQMILSFILITETIMLLVSAMKRLWLFIDALQWATKRFFAFEGMIFFIILLILFSLHLVINKFTRQHFLYAFTILFTLNILFINFFNPDKFIAEQNVKKYVAEKGEEYEMDFDYTAYVSADAVEAGLNLFNNARTDQEKQRAALKLNRAWHSLETYKNKQKQTAISFHFAKENAYNLLSEKIEEINQYSNIETESLNNQ